MYICSAYRSYDDQKTVFNETMQNWVNQGSSLLDAYNETKKSVAVPGYSEHATGLALDITSEEYQDLDENRRIRLSPNGWRKTAINMDLYFVIPRKKRI